MRRILFVLVAAIGAVAIAKRPTIDVRVEERRLELRVDIARARGVGDAGVVRVDARERRRDSRCFWSAITIEYHAASQKKCRCFA
jgi:hypothetical protein